MYGDDCGWNRYTPKRCVEENAAGIRDMKRGHIGSLRMDFLALKNLQEFNYFQLMWSAFVAFLDRVFPHHLALNSIPQIVHCSATSWLLITH